MGGGSRHHAPVRTAYPGKEVGESSDQVSRRTAITEEEIDHDHRREGRRDQRAALEHRGGEFGPEDVIEDTLERRLRRHLLKADIFEHEGTLVIKAGLPGVKKAIVLAVKPELAGTRACDDAGSR
jgi:hypothetical protein